MGLKSEFQKFLTEHHSTIEMEGARDSIPSWVRASHRSSGKYATRS